MIEGICESSLAELAYFSEERIQNEYLYEHYAEADEENLDNYAQNAVDLALSLHESLADDCKEDADLLLELLSEMKCITEDVFKRFKALPLDLIRINNTGT